MKYIGNGLWRDKKHLYIQRICLNCQEKFYNRKDKNQKFCSVICYKSYENTKRIIVFTDKDTQILNGSLLSDGCITKTKKGVNYYYTHSCKFEQYIDFLINEYSFNMRKSEYSRIRKGKTNKNFELRTKVSNSFTKMRDLWYPDGKKVVPKNFKLTSDTLLHWYLGDGSLDNSNGIFLCTDSFINDLDFLIYLFRKIGIIARKKIKKNRILIPNKYVYEFLNYIGFSPIQCFNYKWATIVQESYFGRICKTCNKYFDVESNHQKYCSNGCQRKDWYKNRIVLKENSLLINKNSAINLCKEFSPFMDFKIGVQYESDKRKWAMGEATVDGKYRWIILYKKFIKKEMDIFKTLAHEMGHHHIENLVENMECSEKPLYEAGAQIWAIKIAYELNNMSLCNKLMWDEKMWGLRDGNDEYKMAFELCAPLLKIFNNSVSSASIIPERKDVSILEKFLEDNFYFYNEQSNKHKR